MINLTKNTANGLEAIPQPKPTYYSVQTIQFSFQPHFFDKNKGAIQALITFEDQPEPAIVQTGITLWLVDWDAWNRYRDSQHQQPSMNEMSSRLSKRLIGWEMDVLSTVRHLVRVKITPKASMLNHLKLNLDLCHENP